LRAFVVVVRGEFVEVPLVVVEFAGHAADVGHGAPVQFQEQHRDAEFGGAQHGVGDDGLLADDGVGDFGGPGVQAAGERTAGQEAAGRGVAVVLAGWGTHGGGAGDGVDDDLVDEHGVRGAGGAGAAGVAAHVAVVAQGFGGGVQAGQGQAPNLLGAGAARLRLAAGAGVGHTLARRGGETAFFDQLVLLQVLDGGADVLDALVLAVVGAAGDQGVQLLVGGDLQHAERGQDVGAHRAPGSVRVAGAPAEVHPGGPGRLLPVVRPTGIVLLLLLLVVVFGHAVLPVLVLVIASVLDTPRHRHQATALLARCSPRRPPGGARPPGHEGRAQRPGSVRTKTRPTRHTDNKDKNGRVVGVRHGLIFRP
jgi:hypothetical protein